MRRFFVISALILAFSGCQSVDPASQRSDYERIAPVVMLFVADELDRASADVPEVEFRALGGDRIAGYDFTHDKVVLPPDWKPDHEGVYNLAHEFAHVLQHRDQPRVYEQQLDDALDIAKGNTRNAWLRIDRIWRFCIERETEAMNVAFSYLDMIDALPSEPEKTAFEIAAEMCQPFATWRDEFEKPKGL